MKLPCRLAAVILIPVCCALAFYRVPVPVNDFSAKAGDGIWVRSGGSAVFNLDFPEGGFTILRIWITEMEKGDETVDIRLLTGRDQLDFRISSPVLRKTTSEIFKQSYIDLKIDLNPDAGSSCVLGLRCNGEKGGVFLPVMNASGGPSFWHRFYVQRPLYQAFMFMVRNMAAESVLQNPSFLIISLCIGWAACMVLSVLGFIRAKPHAWRWTIGWVACKGVLLVFFLPVWSGPDEPFHFARIRAMENIRNWIPLWPDTIDREVQLSIRFFGIHTGDDLSRVRHSSEVVETECNRIRSFRSRFSKINNYQNKHPFLYYSTCFSFYSCIGPLDIVMQIHVIRLVNLLIIIILIKYARRIAGYLTQNNEYWKNLASISIAGYTLLSVNCSFINNDNLNLVLAAVILDRMIAWDQKVFRVGKSLMLGFLAGLGLLSKMNMIPVLIGVMAGVIAVKLLSSRDNTRDAIPIRTVIRSLCLILLTALITAGWWYGIPVVLKNSESITGVAEKYVLKDLSIWNFLMHVFPGSSARFPVLWFVTMVSSLTWNAIRYNLIMYYGYLIPLMTCMVFLCIRIAALQKLDLRREHFRILLICLIFVISQWVFCSWMVYEFSCRVGALRPVHGRYFYVPLTAIAGVLIWGFSGIRLTKTGHLLISIFVMAWAALDVIAVWIYVFPWFYY